LKQEYERKDQYNHPNVYLSKFEEKCWSFDKQTYDYIENTSSQQQMLDLLKLAHVYCQQFVEKELDDFDCKLFPKQQYFQNSAVKFTQEKLDGMLSFHEQLVATESNSDDLPFFVSTSVKVQILLMHDKLRSICQQYRQIDGYRNVWVVKPSYNARGLGIYCTNKLNDIYQMGKKSQSKVVQKYIERPFLVRNRKFDVRQWVLVTSWEPLDAFVFETAYLKFCSSDFSLDLEELSDVYRHLSNYTIQKKNSSEEGQKLEIIMSSEEFEQYNRNQEAEFSWSRDLLPKIQDVVYRSLKGVQESQVSSINEASNCFEIFGFDLVLDQELNPWVIEINLSPACKERTPWLTKMLNDSALDLALWIERRVLFSCQIEKENFTKELRDKKNKYAKLKGQTNYNKLETLNDEDTQREHDIKYKWLRIPTCFDELEQQDIVAQMNQ